jgi:GNAT superfamily N-acetyltransferase
MSHTVKVDLLAENEWERYRALRLAALESDGDAFGGNLENERLLSEDDWREKARFFPGLAALINHVDVGFMTVENLNGDFGATCWVGSCWVNPEFRKNGVLKSLFEFVDAHGTENGWEVQGLGVWVENESAIAAYERLGFIHMGGAQESTRKPGKYYQRMIRNVAK